jgi:hypothetical protein
VVNIEIIFKNVNKKILWSLNLKTNINNQEYKKNFQGIIENKEELFEPIEVLKKALKKKVSLKIDTNRKFIINYLKESNLNIEEISFNNKLDFDFSEMEKFIEDTDLPKDILNTELKQENEFLKNVEATMVFLKAYMYFKENPEKVTDIPLFKKLQKENILPKDSILEDIFQIIEENLIHKVDS